MVVTCKDSLCWRPESSFKVKTL